MACPKMSGDYRARAYTGDVSARQASTLTATALQFLSRIDAYEAEVQVLLTEGVDETALSGVRLRLDALRPLAAMLPGLSLAWAELLIRHFELAHMVWQRQGGTLATGRFKQVRESHEAACRRLRRQCEMLVGETDVPGLL